MLKRRKGRRPTDPRMPGTRIRERILVVCEGAKTEPNYFLSFRASNAVIIGSGMNTRSLVELAVRFMRQAQKEKNPFHEIWVVFDRDSFSVKQINEAYGLARANGIKVVFSNEAFELWYILHFKYHNTGLTRDRYCDELTNLLGFPYKKNDPDMFLHLADKIMDAMAHSQQLCKSYNGSGTKKWNANPYTNVHELVLKLLEYNGAGVLP